MASDQINRLKKRLNAIPKAARDAAMASLQKSADELASAQKALVPVRTGALRDSIHTETHPAELKISVKAGGPLTTKPARTGHGSYDYANAIEFGTSKEHAEPFFYPAYRLLKKRLRNRTKRAISKAIKQEFARD